MIIWLALYPKSGNTWVRILIDNLLFSHKGNSNIKIGQFPNKKHFTNMINKEIQKKIENNFEKEMKELGYL